MGEIVKLSEIGTLPDFMPANRYCISFNTTENDEINRAFLRRLTLTCIQAKVNPVEQKIILTHLETVESETNYLAVVLPFVKSINIEIFDNKGNSKLYHEYDVKYLSYAHIFDMDSIKAEPLKYEIVFKLLG